MKRLKVFLVLLLLVLCPVLGYGEDKPLVYIISTGGTIASVDAGGGLTPAIEAEELIEYIPDAKTFAEFGFLKPFRIDSTNFQPGDWVELAKQIQTSIDKGASGIVITHGTDTLAYTAAMLSFMVRNPSVPIIITGSMQPIGREKSDAESNLLNSIQFAAFGPPGVFVVFNGKVLRGDRVSKLDSTRENAFASIDYPPVGEFTDILELKSSNPVLIRKKAWPVLRDEKMTINPRIDPKVAVIKITPGFDPQWLRLFCNRELVHGIILEGFGEGGIPGREPLNLLPVLEEFKEKRIPVVITSQCVYGGVNLEVYEVGRKAVETGVISAGNLTKEACVAKMMWVLGQTGDYDEVKRLMLKD